MHALFRYPAWLLLGVWLLWSTPGRGQCPPPPELSRRFRASLTLPGPLQFRELQALRATYSRCRRAPDSLYANLHHRLGLLFFREGNLPQAIVYTKHAIALREGKPAAEADVILSYLNLAYFLRQNTAAALDTYRQLLAWGQHHRSTSAQAEAYSALSYLFFEQGDYQTAVEHADLALTYVQPQENPMLLCDVLENKGLALKANGRLLEAKLAFEQAIATAFRHHLLAIRRASLHNNLGEVLGRLGDNAGTVAQYQYAVVLYQSEKQPAQLARVFNSLGYHYSTRTREYAKAIPYFEQAIRNFTDPYDRLRAYNNLGAAYWYDRQFGKALDAYQRGFEALELGFKSRGRSHNPPAVFMRMAIRKEYLLTLIQDKADTWLDWAKATGNRAYLQHALATYATADKMVDYLRWEHTGEGSKKFWREKTHRLYEAALETCHRLGQPEQAFYFFEKSRAALLADRLNELGASQLLSPADRKREADLQTTVTTLRQQFSEVKPGDKKYSELQQKRLVAEDDQAAFIDSLKTKNPAYHQYRYDTSAVMLREVRKKLLTNGQTLLEYFVGDSAGYALVATARTARLVRFDAKTYTETARQLLALSADATLNRQFPRFLTLSNRFFREFFEKLAVPNGRVLVSPDGAVVPLDVLSRSTTQPDWLLGDYAFSYTYSARVLVKQPERRSAAAKSFLGLAPVAFASGQPTLRGSDASLNAVADGFFSPTLLVGSTATKRAFLREIPRHRVVQLYAHAQADSTENEPLIFFADSILRASELSTTGLLLTQLVVLSACQTGVGQATRGEGVFSLARALAGAGVPATVTTLWRVDDHATYRLTELFFEKLKQGLPKDEALQRAKLEYLKSAAGRQQLPPFWAGLELIGDAAPLESGMPLWAWAGGGLAVLGLGAWFFKMKNKK